MMIGYSVEGSTDRAFIKGLRNRWCPRIRLIEGRFRGRSGQSQKREFPKTCSELLSKGADLVIFMRDANKEDWRKVLKADSDRCRNEHRHFTIFAVCDRNTECWLCADGIWIANRTHRMVADFRVVDPKGVFESAMSITPSERKEDEIESLIGEAPLHRWLLNKSFETFYDELRARSKGFGCQIEKLRDKQ